MFMAAAVIKSNPTTASQSGKPDHQVYRKRIKEGKFNGRKNKSMYRERGRQRKGETGSGRVGEVQQHRQQQTIGSNCLPCLIAVK